MTAADSDVKWDTFYIKYPLSLNKWVTNHNKYFHLYLNQRKRNSAAAVTQGEKQILPDDDSAGRDVAASPFPLK